MNKDIALALFEDEIFQCKFLVQVIDGIFYEENFPLLESAKPFFNDMYAIYVDYLVLKVIRLFDPKESGRNNKNLSLAYICDIIEINDSSKLKNMQEKISKQQKKLKTYRDKYLGHFDRKVHDFYTHKHYLNNAKDVINGLFEIAEEIVKYQHKNPDIGLAPFVADEAGKIGSFGEVLYNSFIMEKIQDMSDPEYNKDLHNKIWDKKRELKSRFQKGEFFKTTLESNDS